MYIAERLLYTKKSILDFYIVFTMKAACLILPCAQICIHRLSNILFFCHENVKYIVHVVHCAVHGVCIMAEHVLFPLNIKCHALLLKN